MAAGPNRPRTAEKLAVADWRKRAVKLAEQGWSMRKIARQVGRAHSVVFEALKEELEARRPSPEEVDLMRAKMREQIEAQIKEWIPRAKAGSKDAAAALARFWERLAKLDGLDAPTRTEHTGKDGGPMVSFDLSRLTDEQLAAFASSDDSAATESTTPSCNSGDAATDPEAS